MFRHLVDDETSYRWGQIAICLVILIFAVLVLTGCDTHAVKVAEAQAKLARACTPELGEERVLKWTVNAEGHYMLYLTIRQPIGRKGNVAQFVIVSEDELQ